MMDNKREEEYEFDRTGYRWDNDRDIGVLVGQTIKEVSNESDEIIFKTEEGYTYKMFHYQDCCESVHIDDICGDLQDLVGQKIEVAEERTSSEKQSWEEVPDDSADFYDDSFTWTFYCIRCVKASVDIRWFGSSNGYYSEGVSFRRIA